MRLSYQVTVCFLSLLLMSCESESATLQRLQTDRAIACLNAEADQKVYEMARYPGGMTAKNISAPPTPVAESLGREWADWRTKCELAERDLNRFMR